MSRIRTKGTNIELEVRRGLHMLGLRFRLGGAGLPGRPDIVLPKYRTVVLVHGCFWHGHQCQLFRWPKTRPEFWSAKIGMNRDRDQRTVSELSRLGWNVEIVWECELRGRSSKEKSDLMIALARRIRSGRS